jgi:hypothetical protein
MTVKMMAARIPGQTQRFQLHMASSRAAALFAAADTQEKPSQVVNQASSHVFAKLKHRF